MDLSAIIAFPIRLTVRAAVSELKDEQREVIEIVLQQLENGEPVNISAIARELEISQPACYERFTRALVNLRQILDKDPTVREWLGGNV